MSVMEGAGKTKVRVPDMTISITRRKSVDWSAAPRPELLDPELTRMKLEMDKTKIKGLEEKPSWYTTVEKKSLTVR